MAVNPTASQPRVPPRSAFSPPLMPRANSSGVRTLAGGWHHCSVGRYGDHARPSATGGPGNIMADVTLTAKAGALPRDPGALSERQSDASRVGRPAAPALADGGKQG